MTKDGFKDLLGMVNATDEKIDDLAFAVRESITALGGDAVKMAVQIVTIYRLLLELDLTTEEKFKEMFLNTAATMQEQNLANTAQETDELSDISV